MPRSLKCGFSCIFLLLFMMTSIETAQARLNVLSGGITVAYDNTKTTYDNALDGSTPPQVDRRLRKLSIGPIFLFETKSGINDLELRYNPNFAYDFTRTNHTVDQDLKITAVHNFSRIFRSNLSNRFLYTDDPQLITSSNSSDFNSGRRRYWSNDFHLGSSYSYNATSSISGGYSFRILRNEDTGVDGYENYDRHIADLSWKHQIKNGWLLDTTASYTRGLFDPPNQQLVDTVSERLNDLLPAPLDTNETGRPSNDLSEYRLGTRLNWTLSPRKSLMSSYDFSETVYDDALRNNANLHNLSFGGHYQYSRHLSFAIGGGPSYEKTEGFSGNWDYNAHLDLNYEVGKKSTFTAVIKKSYDQKNFSSNNNGLGRDQGLTEFWNWQLDFSSELVRDLEATFFVSYRNERQEDLLLGISNSLENGTLIYTENPETFRNQTIFSRDIYRGGGSISYRFMQYWTGAINCSYRSQDSERINDSYDEYRLFLTLSVQKELLRW